MTSQATELAWHNGRLVPREEAAPSVASSSFHMGTGVFDGVMAYWIGDRHHLHAAAPHFERFCANASRMDLSLPYRPAELRAGAEELLRRAPQRTHYLRPIAFRGTPELLLAPSRRTSVDVVMFGVPVEHDVDEPITCHLTEVTRISSEAIPVAWKVCGAYANSYLAQLDAQAAGCDTALLLDRDGRVSEASTANIFFDDGEALVTPALRADVFPGISRAIVLDLAAELDIGCVERDIAAAEISTFAGAFVCGTLLELRAVASIGSHAFDNRPARNRFAALRGAFREVARGERGTRPSETRQPVRRRQ